MPCHIVNQINPIEVQRVAASSSSAQEVNSFARSNRATTRLIALMARMNGEQKSLSKQNTAKLPGKRWLPKYKSAKQTGALKPTSSRSFE